MIIVILVLFGLVLGSFVNALVWRIHEQSKLSNKPKVSKVHKALSRNLPLTDDSLSILKGRSMCPECRHELSTFDLFPVFSWLALRGKCHYCHKPISVQYPLVELSTGLLFVISYLYWPYTIYGMSNTVLFSLWLLILTGFMALTVYDIRWMLLPNRLIYPISALAGLFTAVHIIYADKPLTALINALLAVMVGGGIFYVLFQVSGGKWIGGGDVKLGWIIGLVLSTPARAVLMIFLASVLGSLLSLPLLARGKLKPKTTIPFGPFLIASAVIVVLFGANIIDWYSHTLLGI